jgi:CRISPR-associated protein Cmr1
LSAPREEASPEKPAISTSLLRPWRDCLDRDWPHAIGADTNGRPLIWQTAQAFGHWREVMQQFAALKIDLRTTNFPFSPRHDPHKPEARHWLSYPVTHHDVLPWKKKNARLPNSLRFKVRSEPDGRLRGVILHVPCLPPKDPFQPDRRAVEAVWAQVHAYLDQAGSLTRTPD